MDIDKRQRYIMCRWDINDIAAAASGREDRTNKTDNK